jgi:hypothetical protein
LWSWAFPEGRPNSAGGFLITAAVIAILVAAALELTIDAPPSLAGAAARIRSIDQQELAQALARAGLDLPPRVHVTLVPEDDPRARQTPSWIVGRAFGSQDVMIFPDRVSSYPYDSLETVVRHEVVHLGLFARAGGRPLPRWFHEGVAVSVETGWGFTGQLRLLLAILRDPSIADMTRLFQSDAEPDTTEAYLLAAALADDLRRRHGAALPGAIAGRVARGMPFARAFEIETGETIDAAASRAWLTYRRWTNWIPAVTSGSAVWSGILILAFAAFFVRLYRRARRRRQWEEEDTHDGGARP